MDFDHDVPADLSAADAVEMLNSVADCEPEYAHTVADAVLCALLRKLGHADVVAAFKNVNKHYA